MGVSGPLLQVAHCQEAETFAAGQSDSFAESFFVKYCRSCHSGANPKGDFDLTIVSHTEPMDIGIYANKDYYFKYDSKAMQDVMAKLNETSDTDARYALMKEAQSIITNDAVNGYLFELAKTGVWNAKINGLWKNSPVQANDLTGVSWSE